MLPEEDDDEGEEKNDMKRDSVFSNEKLEFCRMSVFGAVKTFVAVDDDKTRSGKSSFVDIPRTSEFEKRNSCIRCSCEEEADCWCLS